MDINQQELNAPKHAMFALNHTPNIFEYTHNVGI